MGAACAATTPSARRPAVAGRTRMERRQKAPFLSIISKPRPVTPASSPRTDSIMKHSPSPAQSTRPLFTIGYEKAGFVAFIATLRRAGVATVIDVRDLPLSRRAGFSKRQLAAGAGEAGGGSPP